MFEKIDKYAYAAIKSYAHKCHENTNHLYDGHPYSCHLDIVDLYVDKYFHLLDIEYETPDYYIVKAGARCHDLIEDTRETYNDVRNNTCTIVADIAYALTNEKGKNRKARANDKYYKEMREEIRAWFIKICDRLANARYSKEINSGMLNAYKKEYDQFYKELYIPVFEPMFNELKEILS